MTDIQPSFATDAVAQRIFELRRQRVMLDSDLAALYGVENRTLIQAVKRNLEPFPEDFMFQLSLPEWENLRTQFVISSLKHCGSLLFRQTKKKGASAFNMSAAA